APSDTRRIAALVAASHERRFNVAASRAQDQMWLFHSVTKNDPSMQCLRYRLLEYAENPQIAPLTIEGLDVEKLKIDVQTVDREQTKPPEPFDSWFEVDVFLRIHGRGYRVIPQFEVADYHIDLVIEGMHGRLAVECDGDFWHGPERYEADMIRERMLQRCGWTFWRVRGGEFYRDPDAAMNDLWRTLDRLGIQPYSSESYSKV